MPETLIPYPQFTLGAMRVTVIPVGELALDGGAMFGVVPRVLWEKLTPPDDKNRIALALNCLLIEIGDEKMMLDTGVGTKFSPKHREMYGIERECAIAQLLEPLGLETSDITKVLFTHMHFDHAGGSTKFDDTGKAIPTFENAEFWVHRGEWEDALNPTPKSKASYLKENLLPLEESGRLHLFNGDCTEVIPGLTLRTSGGHTKYHQILVMDDPDGGFIYWGDLIPTSHHLKIPYVMAYDLYPVESMERKAQLLKEAYAKNWLCFFEHDLDVPACRLAYNEEKDFYHAVDVALPSSAKSAV